MSTVTKVFLVLLVIGAIALSTASITITAQSRNWRDLAERYRADAAAAWAEAANVSAQSRVQVEQLNATNQELVKQVATLQTDLAARQNDLADLRATVQRMQVETAADKASLTRLTSALGVEQDRAIKLQEHNEKLLTESHDLQRRNIDLSDHVRELAANVQVLENETRVLQQRNYALQEQLASLREQVAAGPQPPALGVQPATGGAQPLSPQAATPIRGKILQAEGNVLGVSVGSADGVKPGMVFVVYRNDKALGRLVIRDVDPKVAAGVLDRQYGDVQVGDTVVNESGLMAQQ